MDTVVKDTNKNIWRIEETLQKTHTKHPGTGAVSQRMETEPSNQAGQREYGPQEHDEGLGLEQPLLPGLLPVNHHSPVTGKLRMLN